MEDMENDTKQCPFCGGEIAKRARKCKHCMADINENETTTKEDKKTNNRNFNFRITVIISAIALTIAILLGVYFNSGYYIDKKISENIQKDIIGDELDSNISSGSISSKVFYNDERLRLNVLFRDIEGRGLQAIASYYGTNEERQPVYYTYLYDKDDFELYKFIITMADLKQGDTEQNRVEEESQQYFYNVIVNKTFEVSREKMKKVAKIEHRYNDIVFVTADNLIDYIYSHKR